jgi:hypothetical protein
MMKGCATNYSCTGDTRIKLQLKLHSDDNEVLASVKHALCIRNHTVAVNIKISVGCV